MRRYATQLVLGTALFAAGVTVATIAEAKHAKHYYHPRFANAQFIARPPLTVNKRSFLDPGPVVPVGSESAYMVQNTALATTPDQNFARSKFGNEALPRPFEVPGRNEPIFEFETPRYGY